MRMRGFALCSSYGGIVLHSVRYTERQVRMYAVETEREYLLSDEDHLTDKQLWRRCYRQGFRVVPISVSSTHQGAGK